MSGGPGLIVVLFQEVGQFSDPVGDVFQFRMGIAHGLPQVGVTHGLLDNRNGFTLLGENCCMGMPQGVNVDNTIQGVAFFDPGVSDIWRWWNRTRP